MTRLAAATIALCIAGIMWCGCDGSDGSSGSDATETGKADLVVADEYGTASEPEVVLEPEIVVPSCTSECAFVSQQECSSPTAHHICLPSDGCLSWEPPVECDAGYLCEAGLCVQAFGDLDCIAISKCVASCEQDEVCQEDCFAQGSEQGQSDFEDFLGCTDINCGTLFEQEKLASGSKCTLENCQNEYLKCVEIGNANCSETLQCMQGCAEDGDCIGGCVTQADYEALLKLTDILVCFEENCPDPATWEECATSSCLMPSLACL